MSDPRSYIIGITAFFLALMPAVSFGQTDRLSDQSTIQAKDEVTIEEIDTALGQLEASTDLDDPTKVRLQEYYTQAKSELESEATQQNSAARFRSWIETAETDIQQARKQKELAAQVYDFSAAEDLELNQLLKDRLALDQEFRNLEKNRLDAIAEPQHRTNRQAEIPNELVAAQTALKEIESQLNSVTADDDQAMVVQSRVALLRARRQNQLAAIDALENERDAYAAQGELPRLRIDLLTARSRQLEIDIEEFVRLITRRRREDAVSQKQNAEELLTVTAESLKEFAQANIELAELRIDLANDIQNAARSHESIAKDLKRWQDDFSRAQKRVAAMSSSQLGPWLAKKRSELPRLSPLQDSISEYETELRKSQFELFQMEDRRADLSDIDTVISSTAKSLRAKNKVPPENAEAELGKIFGLETEILDSLLKDAKRYFNVRIAANDDRIRLVRFVEDYRLFIERKIFWTRSAASISLQDFSRSRTAIEWLVRPETWSDLQDELRSHFERYSILTLVFGIGIAILLVYRKRIGRKLEDLGIEAEGVSCYVFLTTIRSLLLTILLIAPWPALAWLCHWTISGAVDDPVRSIGFALKATAVWVLIIEFIRQIWRSHGLAESHFDWPGDTGKILRKNLPLLLLGGAPLVFLESIFQRHGEPVFLSSIGRLCLVVFLMLFVFVLFRSFRPQNGVLTGRIAQNPDGLLSQFRNVWHPLVVLIPVALLVLAVIGFQFTAKRMTDNILLSLGFIYCLSVGRAIVFRWSRLRRRRVRWQQLTKARQATGEADGETTDLEAIAAKEEKADVVAMDMQTRRVVSVVFSVIGIIGLSAIWIEVFPALSSILETRMYTVEGIGGASRSITVGSMFLTVLIVFVLIVAWRNLPGLVDVVLVGRFGIEPSTRYAAGTLLQYTAAIVAVFIVCGSLGMTWGRAQWLIAALGVGLGFGLQEIVANFVCGILLLFERPIRVGDFVTLGDAEGVVTRIRSRATTVRNFERQEVVIPNKELITGRIINWTLDDQVIRIMINVGVAYGSDTDFARKLIYGILHENPNVLEDPRPIVVFDEFGDSTLNFSIRAFLENIDERWETIHSINTSIAQRFAEEGIEIAFPQRDLHLRSVDPAAQIAAETIQRER